MVTLNQVISVMEGIEGYVYHFMRYKDPIDLTQYYKLYINTDGYLKVHEVRILVLNEGEEDEAAYVYDIPKEIDPRLPGPFETALINTITAYMGANPELEYYEISGLDEVKNKATIIGYFLNVDNKLEVKTFMSFMLGASIKFRELA